MALALALAKLLIAGLGTLTSYAAILLFKGTAVLVVLLLRLIQLPGYAVNFFLCAARDCTTKVFMAVCAAAVEALALAMNGAASMLKAAASSNSAAVQSIVEVARGRPEVLFNAAVEVCGYAWEVAKNTVVSSVETFFDAVRYVIKHVRAR